MVVEQRPTQNILNINSLTLPRQRIGELQIRKPTLINRQQTIEPTFQ